MVAISGGWKRAPMTSTYGTSRSERGAVQLDAEERGVMLRLRREDVAQGAMAMKAFLRFHAGGMTFVYFSVYLDPFAPGRLFATGRTCAHFLRG